MPLLLTICKIAGTVIAVFMGALGILFETHDEVITKGLLKRKRLNRIGKIFLTLTIISGTVAIIAQIVEATKSRLAEMESKRRDRAVLENLEELYTRQSQTLTNLAEETAVANRSLDYLKYLATPLKDIGLRATYEIPNDEPKLTNFISVVCNKIIGEAAAQYAANRSHGVPFAKANALPSFANISSNTVSAALSNGATLPGTSRLKLPIYPVIRPGYFHIAYLETNEWTNGVANWEDVKRFLDYLEAPKMKLTVYAQRSPFVKILEDFGNGADLEVSFDNVLRSPVLVVLPEEKRMFVQWAVAASPTSIRQSARINSLSDLSNSRGLVFFDPIPPVLNNRLIPQRIAVTLNGYEVELLNINAPNREIDRTINQSSISSPPITPPPQAAQLTVEFPPAEQIEKARPAMY